MENRKRRRHLTSSQLTPFALKFPPVFPAPPYPKADDSHRRTTQAAYPRIESAESALLRHELAPLGNKLVLRVAWTILAKSGV